MRPRFSVPADVRNVYHADCDCRVVLNLLADKWSALALGALQDGPVRFGAVKAKLGGISPKVLTAVLRRLVDNELITRTVYPDVPLRVEYELTELGRDAFVPLASLIHWVEGNIERFPAPS